MANLIAALLQSAPGPDTATACYTSTQWQKEVASYSMTHRRAQLQVRLTWRHQHIQIMRGTDAVALSPDSLQLLRHLDQASGPLLLVRARRLCLQVAQHLPQ
jgi:hypothetical protein